MLAERIQTSLNRQHAVLCGRGTTALWLALRAIARRDGPGEVIIPDLLCQTALDGVLLAGFTPIFAPVVPGRFTLHAESLRTLITPRTRAILFVHLFGHLADMDAIQLVANGVPIIEDAVQGIGGHYGGRPAGSPGDLSFISFDATKMIGGRGGILLFDDDTLVDGIRADLARLDAPLPRDFSGVASLLPVTAAEVYNRQLVNAVPTLLRPFNPSPANVAQIERDWETLTARVADRNEKAQFLDSHLSTLPITLPQIRDGDAIWRYTVTASTAAVAGRIARGLQEAGLSGSRLYYPLSRLFGQTTDSGDLANRLVNLRVDESTTQMALEDTVKVIQALPWAKLLAKNLRNEAI